MLSNKFIKCSGCGSLVLDIDGPVHRYIGAIAGCWNIYRKVLSRKFGIYNYPEIHRLTVDAYAVQHPGKESKLTIQSVAVHLLGLYFCLEKNMSERNITEQIRKSLLYKNNFYWLVPPENPGRYTISDVYKCKDFGEHREAVLNWAADVWNAWSDHHKEVKAWAELK